MNRTHLISALALISPVALAHAQSTATVTGVVTDPTGATVPGATVIIHGLQTGLDRTLQTDSGGVYTAASMQPGDYSVTINASGFGPFVVKKVTLLVDQRTAVDAKLVLGNTAQTVEVDSAAPIMDTDTVTVGSVIDQQTVQNIPLNGRHFLDLTNLTPGTVVPPVTGSLTAPSRGLGANSFNTAGAREDAVNFMVNGINLKTCRRTRSRFSPRSTRHRSSSSTTRHTRRNTGATQARS